MLGQLPFQVGNLLPLEEEGSIEVLSSATMAESGTDSIVRPTRPREVFMLCHPPLPALPQPPDVHLDNETLSNISPDTLPPLNESDEQKAAREKKNK